MPDAQTSLTDIPVKRSSRRRPSSAPEAQEPTAPEGTPVVVVPPVAVPEPEQIVAPAATVPEVPTQPPPAMVSVAAAPSPEPQLPNSPFRRHDVVQVLDLNSPHYGQFFMVGDVLRNKVHGYYLMRGMHKEHITVELRHCYYIGSAKIRSATPCSPKWISDNRPS